MAVKFVSNIQTQNDAVREILNASITLKTHALDANALECDECARIGDKLDECARFIDRQNHLIADNEDKLRDAIDKVRGNAAISFAISCSCIASELSYTDKVFKVVSDDLYDACDVFDVVLDDAFFRLHW